MPAIVTLANWGLVREQVHPELAGWLNIVESVLAAGLSHVPEKQGRQPGNQSEQTLMHDLAETYCRFTGEPLTRSKKGFTAFAQEMLKAIPIEVKHFDYAVQRECALWRNRSNFAPQKLRRNRLRTTI